MFGKRPIISSLRGMVAAAHPQAALAGARILDQGGNAFDAAVTVAATLNVSEPFMSGLAGQGMAVCWQQSTQRMHTLDFVTGVPLDFAADGLTKSDIFMGPKSSGAPGSLAAWYEISRKLGTLSFGELLMPAIRLASDGVAVTHGIPTVTGEWLDLREQEAEWLRVYTDGQGAINVGSVLRQPDLAATFEAIADHGPGYLYDGPLGEKMCSHLRERGGFLSRDDLSRVAPQWLEPLVTQYRGMQVHTLPPPAEAFQYLLTLALLDRVDFSDTQLGSVEHYDLVFRAVRLAAECRVKHNLADRDVIESLLDTNSTDQLLRQFQDDKPIRSRTQQWREIKDPALFARREYTTSFSIADAQGNMICLTQSLGSIYGSGVVIPGTGVCMNNFLNWGDLESDSPNVLRPGGLLAMCLAPSIATQNGESVLALGTPGSYGIPQTQAQAMVYLADFGMELQDAIEAPRARLLDGALVHVENRVDPVVLAQLNVRGHECVADDPWTRKVGGLHAVQRDPSTGVLTGAADPRRDGYAVGC